MYWDVAVKIKEPIGISACIKQAFWPFLDYGFNTASKIGNFRLNTAFTIKILINRIKIWLIFLKSKKKLAAFKSNLNLKVSEFSCVIKTVIQKWQKSVIKNQNASSISKYLGFNALHPSTRYYGTKKYPVFMSSP